MSLREWEEIWRKGRICYEHHERWCQKSLWNQDKQLPLASPCPLKQSPTRKVGGQGFQLHKHRLTSPSSWFLLNMVGNVFQEVLIHHTPGNAVRLAGLQLSSLSFFFLEIGVMLLFFPNPLNSPHSHNFSDMIMSGLTMPIPLIIKDDPVRSHGLVHVQFTQMFPEFILLYWGSLHISKLSHGLEGPGIPEDNSRQKNNEEMKTFSTSIFSLPLVTSWIATQFNTRTFLALPSLLIFQWKPSSSVPSQSCKCSNCTLLQRANFSSEGLYSSHWAFINLPHASSQNTISR